MVQAANTAALLGKRVILSNLGVMPALSLLPQGLPALTSQAPPQIQPHALQHIPQHLAHSVGKEKIQGLL